MLQDPELEWTCHVCGDRRPDPLIAVLTVQEGLLSVNVRFCKDRMGCRQAARRVAQNWLDNLTAGRDV